MASGAMTIELPDVTPAKGGLLNVLDAHGLLKTNTDPHLGAGVVYEQLLCGVPKLAPGLCDDALGLDPETEKTFESPDDDESLAFAIYKGLACSPAYGDYEAKAKDFLARGASYGAELGFKSLVLDGASVVPGGPFSPVTALAIAERVAGNQMAGVGMISVGRYGASILADSRVVREHDNLLETVQGLPIINGAGISEDLGVTTPSAANGFYMWVHAPIQVMRGEVIYNEGYGLETNTQVGLAEQIMAVTNPCYILAIEVDPDL